MISSRRSFGRPALHFVAGRVGFILKTLKSAFANCGGLNLRKSRYAGNLITSVSPTQRSQIMHALILANGVRKTSAPARNAATVRNVLGRVGHVLPNPVAVIDVACSSGVDSLSTLHCVAEFRKVSKYVLADLYTTILVDHDGSMVYDEFGHPLQARIGPCFFSFSFSYNYPWQRWLHLPQLIVSKLVSKTVPAVTQAPRRIVLISEELGGESLVEPFELRTMSVFDPSGFSERYSLVVCLHLLVERYFDREQIERGIDNLKLLVDENGILIVGDRESPRVFVREKGCFREEALG